MNWKLKGTFMKNTSVTFKESKKNGEKLTMLTAYDYTTAKLLDESGIDSILVGDSLGMVVLGYDDTLSVTMEDMIHHSAAVARGAKNALTGPVERNDLQTVKKHVESLKGEDRQIYILLAKRLVNLAKAKNEDRDYSELSEFLDLS